MHGAVSHPSPDLLIWAALFLIGAVWSWVLYLRSFVPQAPTFIASGEGHFVHIVMHAVMCLMLFFMDDPVMRIAMVAALGTTGLIVIVSLTKSLRNGESPGQGVIAGSLYHLVALGVMIAATLAMGDAHGATGGHHMEAAASGGGFPWQAPFLVLFLLDGAATLIFALFLPRTLMRMSGVVRPTSRDIHAIRVAAPPHIIMALGMAAMLAP